MNYQYYFSLKKLFLVILILAGIFITDSPSYATTLPPLPPEFFETPGSFPQTPSPPTPSPPGIQTPILATSFEIPNPFKHKTFESLINAIINFIFYVSLAIAPLMILIAAFYFITAGGNPQKIERGKKIIIYTFIGLLIVFLAKALVSVIQDYIFK